MFSNFSLVHPCFASPSSKFEQARVCKAYWPVLMRPANEVCKSASSRLNSSKLLEFSACVECMIITLCQQASEQLPVFLHAGNCSYIVFVIHSCYRAV